MWLFPGIPQFEAEFHIRVESRVAHHDSFVAERLEFLGLARIARLPRRDILLQCIACQNPAVFTSQSNLQCHGVIEIRENSRRNKLYLLHGGHTSTYDLDVQPNPGKGATTNRAFLLLLFSSLHHGCQ